MIKRIFIAIIAAILTFTVSQAKELFPDSETAKNDVELGVEGIARLCPTGLWDHWTSMVLTSEQLKRLIDN